MAERVTPEVLPPESPAGAQPHARRGLPFFWRLGAGWRLLRDPRARGWEKALLVASVAYVVFPLDAMPDFAPLIGWVDDLGVLAFATAALHKALSRYRT